MTVDTPITVWKEDIQVLHVALRDDPTHRATRTVALSLLCWVNFDGTGDVCGVDVHDLPPGLADAIPNYTGTDIIGRTLLDDGWLWIPLSEKSTNRRRSGVADVELVLDDEGLTSLTLSFRSET